MRKGQAALEFLMTYGWAIMVVLAAIGALAYFGVLNPSNFLPSKCVASPGFSCVGKPQVTATYIAQAITLNAGYSVAAVTAPVVGSSTTAVRTCAKGTTFANCPVGNATVGQTLVDGTTYVFYIPGTFTAGQSIKEDVTITAPNPNSGLTDTYVISLTGKI